MKKIVSLLLCSWILTWTAASTAQATDDPILMFQVDGETHSLSLSDLKALPSVEFSTTTIWTDGVQNFVGVSLHLLLDQLKVTAGTLTASAINDYAVKIPVSDAIENGPIIAYSQNGAEMSARDKGPFWIVYPYDSDPTYQTEVIYSRSIWQLVRIELAE